MAAQSEVISFTASAGSHALSLNGTFTPSTALLWCSARAGTTETIEMLSLGGIDIVNSLNSGASTFVDGTGKQTKASNSDWTHYNRSGGTITKILSVTGTSSGAGAITFNVGTGDSNYVIYGIVFA